VAVTFQHKYRYSKLLYDLCPLQDLLLDLLSLGVERAELERAVWKTPAEPT
jgi:hypothetical protein